MHVCSYSSGQCYQIAEGILVDNIAKSLSVRVIENCDVYVAENKEWHR